MADEYESVNLEAVAPDIDAAQEPRKQTPASENFRRLEEKARQLEKELERERQEKQWMMQQRQAPEQQHTMQQEEDINWNEFESDDFAESKKVGKALKSIKKQLEKKDQEISFLHANLQNKDFSEVVTEENIKKYIMNDPDLVRAVQTASNPGQTMYKLIAKNADYQGEVSRKSRPMTQEHKKLAENAERPRTTSVGVRSEAVRTAARFSELSKQDRAALWAETQRLARRAR